MLKFVDRRVSRFPVEERIEHQLALHRIQRASRFLEVCMNLAETRLEFFQ